MENICNITIKLGLHEAVFAVFRPLFTVISNYSIFMETSNRIRPRVECNIAPLRHRVICNIVHLGFFVDGHNSAFLTLESLLLSSEY